MTTKDNIELIKSWSLNLESGEVRQDALWGYRVLGVAVDLEASFFIHLRLGRDGRQFAAHSACTFLTELIGLDHACAISEIDDFYFIIKRIKSFIETKVPKIFIYDFKILKI